MILLPQKSIALQVSTYNRNFKSSTKKFLPCFWVFVVLENASFVAYLLGHCLEISSIACDLYDCSRSILKSD